MSNYYLYFFSVRQLVTVTLKALWDLLTTTPRIPSLVMTKANVLAKKRLLETSVIAAKTPTGMWAQGTVVSSVCAMKLVHLTTAVTSSQGNVRVNLEWVEGHVTNVSLIIMASLIRDASVSTLIKAILLLTKSWTLHNDVSGFEIELSRYFFLFLKFFSLLLLLSILVLFCKWANRIVSRKWTLDHICYICTD